MEFDTTLWKVDGTGFSRVKEVGSERASGLYTEFCPTRKIFVSISGYCNKLSVFSSLTGQMIKERCLPCVFGVEYDDEIKALAVNDNQLAVVTVPEDHYVLMVFQLDSLLSESPSQEISHRTFDFDQNYCGLHSLVLHQTSICVVLEGVGE